MTNPPNDDVKKLTTDLISSDYDLRDNAVNALDALGWQPGKDAAGAAYWLHKFEIGKVVDIGPPAVDVLLSKMKESAMMAKDCVEALGKIGDERASAPLVDILSEESAPHMREVIVTALAKIGHPSATDAFLSALEDEEPKTRLTAAEALDKLGWTPDESKTGALYWAVKYLFSDEQEVRQDAAEMLGQATWQPDESEAGAVYWIIKRQWDRCVELGLPAVTPLFIHLQSPDEGVRSAVSDALVQIAAPAVEQLTALLDTSFKWGHSSDGSQQLRITAPAVLGKIGDPRAIKVLIDLFNRVEKTLDHKQAAANALGAIGEPALEPLIQALQEKNISDHQGVAWALAKIGDTRAVEPLINAIAPGAQPSYQSHERTAVVQALEAITGQKLGDAVPKWQEWWAANAPGS